MVKSAPRRGGTGLPDILRPSFGLWAVGSERRRRSEGRLVAGWDPRVTDVLNRSVFNQPSDGTMKSGSIPL